MGHATNARLSFPVSSTQRPRSEARRELGFANLRFEARGGARAGMVRIFLRGTQSPRIVYITTVDKVARTTDYC